MQCWIYIEFDFEFLFQVVGTISLRLFDVYHDYKENDAAQLYHKCARWLCQIFHNVIVMFSLQYLLFSQI